MLPTEAAAKKYITETTKLMNGWTNNLPLKDIAFKAIGIMPSLLLQKLSKTSKAKDHLKALERIIDLWSNGNIDELLFEGETIQSRKSIGELSKKFTLLMEKENVNGALKLLTSNISNGILPLDDKTLSLLKQKHPTSSELNEEVLLRGEKPSVHLVVFEDIDENMVKEAALKTKGSSDPSGLDADGWRKILVSKSYGTINGDLRRAFANVIKKICTEKLPVDTTKDETPLEAFLACKLIPLDKNPGLRPIGVAEVLRRTAGKVAMKVVKEDIKKAAGCLQLCAGQEAGCEAAIHAMYKIFESNETEAILIVVAENTFNSTNRKALLHNIEYLCPAIATFLYNCYTISARLFIIGGKESRSREGATQGDPTAMAAYALGLPPLLDYLQSVKRSVKHVAFADDLTGAGNLEEIKIC